MSKFKNHEWFLVQFRPNCHRVAENNLKRQGFNTFLPLQELTKRRKFQFLNCLCPLFPGYLFVSFDPKISPWWKIKSTKGVIRLVSFSDRPHPVPYDLISGLMRRCNQNGTILLNELGTGKEVKLLTGPFADFVATIEHIDMQERVWVLLEFMGQKTRLITKYDGLVSS